jgi:Ca2+-binding RTX toxin-like protein
MALNAYIRGTKFADLLDGSGLRDKIQGKGGADVINAGAGDDKVKGGNGGDLITGGAGNDDIDGGKGFDTAIYQGLFQDYALSFADKSNLTGTVIDTVANRDGTDTLKNVEFLLFKNAIYDVANDVVYILDQPPTPGDSSDNPADEGFIGTESFSHLANNGADDSNIANISIEVKTVPHGLQDFFVL